MDSLGRISGLDLVRRLTVCKKLDKHWGCVNTISFNSYGDILVSGSNDRMIILWHWDSGNVKLSFHSGHSKHVFQSKFMPFTDDRIIVSCAADGEVRHTQIADGGKVATTLLGQHEGRAHRLAIEPGSSHIFYSCGEEGLVQHFDLRTKSSTKLFICKSFRDTSVYMHIISLNAMAIDPRNHNIFAIAGSDEFARIYDIRKNNWDGSNNCEPTDCFCPPHLIGNYSVGITGLAFSDQSELLASYADELIYLFSKNDGLGSNPNDRYGGGGSSSASSSSSSDSNGMSGLQVYKGHGNCDSMKGVSFFGPHCEYVVSGSDCGHIFIWRKRDGELLRVMEGDADIVNCIEPHPSAPLFASSGIERDIKIWTPTATELAPPVKMDEIKQPKSRTKLYIDLVSRIFAPWHSASADGGESLVIDSDLLDILMRDDLDDSADDGDGAGSGENDDGDGEDNGEQAENPVDCSGS